MWADDGVGESLLSGSGTMGGRAASCTDSWGGFLAGWFP